MKSITFTAIAATLLLAGCTPPPPVISDINDSAIHVQANSAVPMGEVQREAQNGCQIYHKKAVGISERCLDGYCSRKDYLFACQ